LILLLLLAGQGAWTLRDSGVGQVGTIEEISEALFGTWMLPFQATVLLLTVAAVGSVALARYEGVLRGEQPVIEPVVDDGGEQ
jgi:NADH:ubiquinone oxidoreductase subunit 6 (subunit J)